MRVLHVVENLDHGSVESWLCRMLSHARKRGVDIDWTFYCILQKSGSNDERVRALGAQVIHSPVRIGEKRAFIHALRAELRRGKYDVLHCHHDLVSAVYLLAAVGLPITKRIVHVHNADEDVLTPSALKQAIVRPLFRRTCLMLADRIVGNSSHTLDTFITGRGRRKGIDIVHYLGIDPIPFEVATADRLRFRYKLGFAENANILLFAGRMVAEKNPVFAVEVLAEMHRLDPGVVGVFVGRGSLDEVVRQRAMKLGVADAVRHLGWRADVPEIMCCCDWFILPHPEHPVEGFGVAIVEAQLAGLRMLISRGILDEPLLPTASFRRIALSEGPQAWARAAMELLSYPVPSRPASLVALGESPMDMDRSLKHLLQIHR